MIFAWGDSVKLKRPEVKVKYGLSQGSVCGFREIDSSDLAENLKVPLGTVLVLVEGANGLSVEIPESELEPL